MRTSFVFFLFCISIVVYVYTNYVFSCRGRASDKLELFADLTAACVAHCGPGIAPVLAGVLMDTDLELQSDKGEVVFAGREHAEGDIANYVKRVARHKGQPFAVMAKQVRPAGRTGAF